MVSHAHGQGFADTNFIIPEVVERVEITKGPYFAYQGDFATAGAVNMVSRDDFEHSSAGARPGRLARARRRRLPRPRDRQPEVRGRRSRRRSPPRSGDTNGPFDNPEGWDQYKLFNKLTFALPTWSLSIGE